MIGNLDHGVLRRDLVARSAVAVSLGHLVFDGLHEPERNDRAVHHAEPAKAAGARTAVARQNAFRHSAVKLDRDRCVFGFIIHVQQPTTFRRDHEARGLIRPDCPRPVDHEVDIICDRLDAARLSRPFAFNDLHVMSDPERRAMTVARFLGAEPQGHARSVACGAHRAAKRDACAIVRDGLAVVGEQIVLTVPAPIQVARDRRDAVGTIVGVVLLKDHLVAAHHRPAAAVDAAVGDAHIVAGHHEEKRARALFRTIDVAIFDTHKTRVAHHDAVAGQIGARLVLGRVLQQILVDDQFEPDAPDGDVMRQHLFRSRQFVPIRRFGFADDAGAVFAGMDEKIFHAERMRPLDQSLGRLLAVRPIELGRLPRFAAQQRARRNPQGGVALKTSARQMDDPALTLRRFRQRGLQGERIVQPVIGDRAERGDIKHLIAPHFAVRADLHLTRRPPAVAPAAPVMHIRGIDPRRQVGRERRIQRPDIAPGQRQFDAAALCILQHGPRLAVTVQAPPEDAQPAAWRSVSAQIAMQPPHGRLVDDEGGRHAAVRDDAAGQQPRARRFRKFKTEARFRHGQRLDTASAGEVDIRPCARRANKTVGQRDGFDHRIRTPCAAVDQHAFPRGDRCRPPDHARPLAGRRASGEGRDHQHTPDHRPVLTLKPAALNAPCA